MKRSMLAAALMCLAVASPRAQTTSPYIAEIKRYYYDSVKRNLSAMVEKMPEEHFAFKPVPEIRSFGEAVAHVADAQARNCNLVSGAGSKTVNADKKNTKAELLAALKESFAICDAAFAALTDTRASEMTDSTVASGATAPGQRLAIGVHRFRRRRHDAFEPEIDRHVAVLLVGMRDHAHE